jgi:type IV secretion system protein VirB9
MTPPFRGAALSASRQLSHTSFGKSALALLLMSASVLAGCSHLQKPPEIALDDPAEPAVILADPPAPVQVVELPKPLPLPGQLKPLPGGKPTPEAADPAARVNQANAAARVQPVRNGARPRKPTWPRSPGSTPKTSSLPCVVRTRRL